MRLTIPGAWIGLMLICSGCEVQRSLTIQSNPAGALVYLNDQEIGRTPVTQYFKWYGTYDVELRKDGYESLRTTAKVWAPWWQVPPIDFIACFVPAQLEDHHDLSFTLHEPTARQLDPQRMITSAEKLRAKFDAGDPTTKPSAAH
jgi:PEGA domain